MYVAGEAKSHCVLATLRTIVEYFAKRPDVTRKFRLLTDCTSSVRHPSIDFETAANAELERYRGLGLGLAKSTNPIE